jgi:hypothetical protein
VPRHTVIGGKNLTNERGASGSMSPYVRTNPSGIALTRERTRAVRDWVRSESRGVTAALRRAPCTRASGRRRRR